MDLIVVSPADTMQKDKFYTDFAAVKREVLPYVEISVRKPLGTNQFGIERGPLGAVQSVEHGETLRAALASAMPGHSFSVSTRSYPDEYVIEWHEVGN